MKWLFLVHQVQTRNSRERVKVWRLIKKTGAVLHRNSVYVLPYDRERLEDIQWVCQQIRDSKGEASVYVSEAFDKEEDSRLKALFISARKEEYSEIAMAAQRLLDRVVSARKQGRMTHSLIKALIKEESDLVQSLKDVSRIDFFARSAPRSLTRTFRDLRKTLESSVVTSSAPASGRYERRAFQNRIWATRQHIHIDRICSAWLILRFIDPHARFVFAPENMLPGDAIPFDVLGAEFSHHGEDCTYETLSRVFQIRDPAVRIIGEIVHDVDLKDHKFGRPEGSGLDTILRAIESTSADDHEVLRRGSTLLDTLYKYYLKNKRRPSE